MVDWIRKNIREQKQVDFVETLPETPTHAPSPFDELEKKQMLSLLWEEIALLPQREKAVMQLYCENKTYQQIAEETGLTVKQVENIIYLAKQKMKKY